MRLRRTWVGAACALLVSCTGSPTATHPATSPPPPSPPASGLIVLAAAPLLAAFTQIDTQFTAAHPGVTVTVITYQGSQALGTLVKAGAPGDVFASTDPTVMADLQGSGGVATGTVTAFARDHLRIVVPAGNPRGIASLADLAKPGTSFVVADPSLAEGRDAVRALALAGIRARPKATEPSVAFILTTVLAGNADAGLAYASDVAGGGSGVTGVALPAAQDVAVDDQIGALHSSTNPAAAQSYVRFVASPAGRGILQAAGFGAPGH